MIFLFLANGVESYEASSFVDVFSWTHMEKNQ